MKIFKRLKSRFDNSILSKQGRYSRKHGKRLFYEAYDRLYKEKLMKEVFVCPEYSVCNIANSCYAAFTYRLHEGKPVGVIINTSMLRELQLEEKVLARLWFSQPKYIRKKRVIVLDEATIEVMRKLKMETDKNGPDLDTEFSINRKNIIK